ncbi:MAG: hypothetical protein NTU48_07545 [Legionellales bacterium]|nr:hypothetical protein [Legionellales bacterium]
MNSKLEQALIQTPRNSDAYQETLNIMYDYRTRNNAVKLLKKSKDLLSAWKHSHDSSAPAFEAAQQGGTRVDRFYRRKLLERYLSGDNAGFYDLHHLQRGSAYYFIKNAIYQLKETIQHPSELKLIPGKGKHSFGVPVLKEIIIDICTEARLHFQPIVDKDGRWGKVLVTVQPRKLMIAAIPSSAVIDPITSSAAIDVGASLIQQGLIQPSQTLKADSLDNEDIDQTPTYPPAAGDISGFIEDDSEKAFTSHDIAKAMAGLDEDDIEQAPSYPPMAAAMAGLDEDDIEQAPTYPPMTAAMAGLDEDDIEQAPTYSPMAAAMAGVNENELNQASTYPPMAHSLKTNGLVRAPGSPKSISTSLSPIVKKQAYTPQLFKPWTSPLAELGKAHDKTKAKPLELNLHAKELVPATVQPKKHLDEGPEDIYGSRASY